MKKILFFLFALLVSASITHAQPLREFCLGDSYEPALRLRDELPEWAQCGPGEYFFYAGGEIYSFTSPEALQEAVSDFYWNPPANTSPPRLVAFFPPQPVIPAGESSIDQFCQSIVSLAGNPTGLLQNPTLTEPEPPCVPYWYKKDSEETRLYGDSWTAGVAYEIAVFIYDNQADVYNMYTATITEWSQIQLLLTNLDDTVLVYIKTVPPRPTCDDHIILPEQEYYAIAYLGLYPFQHLSGTRFQVNFGIGSGVPFNQPIRLTGQCLVRDDDTASGMPMLLDSHQVWRNGHAIMPYPEFVVDPEVTGSANAYSLEEFQRIAVHQVVDYDFLFDLIDDN